MDPFKDIKAAIHSYNSITSQYESRLEAHMNAAENAKEKYSALLPKKLESKGWLKGLFTKTPTIDSETIEKLEKLEDTIHYHESDIEKTSNFIEEMQHDLIGTLNDFFIKSDSVYKETEASFLKLKDFGAMLFPYSEKLDFIMKLPEGRKKRKAIRKLNKLNDNIQDSFFEYERVIHEYIRKTAIKGEFTKKVDPDIKMNSFDSKPFYKILNDEISPDNFPILKEHIDSLKEVVNANYDCLGKTLETYILFTLDQFDVI